MKQLDYRHGSNAGITVGETVADTGMEVTRAGAVKGRLQGASSGAPGCESFHDERAVLT